MPVKFSIRDLMLVTVIVAVGTSWWLDHRRLVAELTPSVTFGLTPNGTPTPTLDLEFKQGSFGPTVPKAGATSQVSRLSRSLTRALLTSAKASHPAASTRQE